MKSIPTINAEMIKHMDKLTSFEKTKVVVEIDRILTSPYRAHLLNLIYYYVYYEPNDKCIYISEKKNIEENHDGDPAKENNDKYCYKIYIMSKLLRGW